MQKKNSGTVALFHDMEQGTVGLYFEVAHGMPPTAALANSSLWSFIVLVHSSVDPSRAARVESTPTQKPRRLLLVVGPSIESER
jgi:hypothetical protein